MGVLERGRIDLEPSCELLDAVLRKRRVWLLLSLGPVAPERQKTLFIEGDDGALYSAEQRTWIVERAGMVRVMIYALEGAFLGEGEFSPATMAMLGAEVVLCEMRVIGL